VTQDGRNVWLRQQPAHSGRVKRDTPFAWEGKDKRGARVKGKSLAPDEQTLRAELRRQGRRAPRASASNVRAARCGRGQCGRLSRSSAASWPPCWPRAFRCCQSFEIVGNGHEKAAMQRLILEVKADVEGGTSLHEALAKHPLYFDDLFVNLVEAGEHAGALESLLDKIATLQGKDRGPEEEG